MKILVVDDDVAVARAAMRLLISLGHEVVMASGANAASLAIDFLDMHGPFEVIISDYTMPDKTGDVVLTEVNRRNPDIACVLSTTNTGQVMQRCPSKTVLLAKPYGLSDLRLALDQAVQKAKA